MAQRDWIEKDFYAVLGVAEDASKADIKKAYRKLAQRYHPDANAGDADAEARFKEISEAHSILTDDQKRKEYDELRRFAASGGQRFYGFTPGGGGSGNVRINIEDLFADGPGGNPFEDLFGFRAQTRGSDAESAVTLSFDDAVAGTTVSLGDGTKVRIPPGVNDGARIKVAGKGAPGRGGAPPGDLYVRVSVEQHPVFTLGKEGTLTVLLPLTYTEAALGAKVEVPTLGVPVTVKIPPGTQNGKTLRVKGKGAPNRSGGHGDLLVRIDVQIPLKLSRKEREALEAFEAIHKESPRSHLEQYINGKAEAS